MCDVVVVGIHMELLLLRTGGLIKNLTLSAGYRVSSGKMLVTSWEGCGWKQS
jgi:hypothetical protein